MDAQVRNSSAVPCLTLRGLSKHFGGLQAVKDITMEVHPGDRTGILGPNGAGKTTLFHLITGVLPPTSGQILLFGHDVTRWSPYRRTALGMGTDVTDYHPVSQAHTPRGLSLQRWAL